jgi:cell division protein FtsN
MMDRSMADSVHTKRDFWITPGHLAALGAATFFIALLAFFVGIQVGRSQRNHPEATARATLIPDPEQQDALEGLLREVEAAQSAAPTLTFTETLTEGNPPEPPVAAVEEPPATTDVVPPADPPPVPPPPPPASAPLPKGGWAVQIASYDSRTEADSHVDDLMKGGHKAYRVAALIRGRTWYRVRVGGYDTKNAAETARVALSTALGNRDLMLAEAP